MLYLTVSLVKVWPNSFQTKSQKYKKIGKYFIKFATFANLLRPENRSGIFAH